MVAKKTKKKSAKATKVVKKKPTKRGKPARRVGQERRHSNGKVQRRATFKPRKKKVPKNRTPLQRHEDSCKVCRSPLRADIEEAYSEGMSPLDIACDKRFKKFLKEDRSPVYRHVKAFKLDKGRDDSTLKKIRILLERAKLGNRKVSDPLLGQLLKLEAQITGELVERSHIEGEIGLRLTTDEVVNKRLKNLHERLAGGQKITVGKLEDAK